MFKGFEWSTSWSSASQNFLRLRPNWIINSQEHGTKENTSRSLFSPCPNRESGPKASSCVLKLSVTAFIMSRVHWCHQSLRHIRPTTAVTTHHSPPPPTASGCTGETNRQPRPRSSHFPSHRFVFLGLGGGFARLASFSPRFWLLLRGEMREHLFIKLFVFLYSFPSSCFSISVSLVTTLFLPASLPNQRFLEFSF